MKFLVNNQPPTALARFLAEDLGIPAIHVRDIELASADDFALWEYAALFLMYPVAKLLWGRVRNCRRRELLDVFGRKWTQIVFVT